MHAHAFSLDSKKHPIALARQYQRWCDHDDALGAASVTADLQRRFSQKEGPWEPPEATAVQAMTKLAAARRMDRPTLSLAGMEKAELRRMAMQQVPDEDDDAERGRQAVVTVRRTVSGYSGRGGGAGTADQASPAHWFFKRYRLTSIGSAAFGREKVEG